MQHTYTVKKPGVYFLKKFLSILFVTSDLQKIHPFFKADNWTYANSNVHATKHAFESCEKKRER